MHSSLPGRRRFLKGGAALAGLAVGGIQAARSQTIGSQTEEGRGSDLGIYGKRSHFENSGRLPTSGTLGMGHADYYTPLQDSVGIITPNPLHFTQSHSEMPDIDPKQYRLSIHGMVDRPLSFSLDDLKRLPSESHIYFLECVGNSSPGIARHNVKGPMRGTVQGLHGNTSCSEWTGVRLSLLLKETGMQKGASWLVSEGWDAAKYSYTLPLTKALDDVMVVYGQNGEAVRPEQGYPVRLFVPGWEAPYSVKWLRQIKVVDQPYMTWDESIHHSSPNIAYLGGKARWYDFAMPPKSVITRPSGGQVLPAPGFYEITGLAWSGGGMVRRVEVSTDGGRTWKDARLQEPVLRMAHTRFSMDWTWDGNEVVLQSRCTDQRGEIQPSVEELDKDWTLSGNERIQATSFINHFNAIQPWRVERDGSVHDAMFS